MPLLPSNRMTPRPVASVGFPAKNVRFVRRAFVFLRKVSINA